MKTKVPSLLLIAFSVFSPVLAQNSETDRDQTLVQTAPGYVNHPSVEVLSFLVGRWEGSSGNTKIEEIWTPVSNGSMIGLRKSAKDGRIETQVTIMEEGKFGAFGRSRSFDSSFMMCGQPSNVSLIQYSEQSVDLQVVDDNQEKITLTYKVIDKDKLSISTGLGERITLTKAAM